MSAPSERKGPQSAALHYPEDCQGACDCGVDGVGTNSAVALLTQAGAPRRGLDSAPRRDRCRGPRPLEEDSSPALPS